MNTKPIRTVEELNTALLRIEQLWGAAMATPEGDELEVLSLLVERYENEHFSIPASNPTEALKFRISSSGSLDCVSRGTSSL